MFELMAGVFALGVVAQIVFWSVVGVLFPVFWLWMLLDAAFRPEREYAGGGKEKLVWLLVLILFQLIAPVYFLAVFYRRPSTGLGTFQPAA